MREPALTAEEWSEFLVPERWQGGRVEGRTLFVASDCGGEPYAEEVELDAHETAAKCLHGQPFGFTKQHRRALLYLVDAMNGATPMNIQNRVAHAVLAFAPEYREVADRIEALLPPEE